MAIPARGSVISGAHLVPTRVGLMRLLLILIKRLGTLIWCVGLMVPSPMMAVNNLAPGKQMIIPTMVKAVTMALALPQLMF